MADEYRFLPVRNYLVFYRVTAEEVFVDRVLYKKRDYLQLLGGCKIGRASVPASRRPLLLLSLLGD